MFGLMQAAAHGSYGSALLQTLLALVGVCALAVVLLRFVGARGLGRLGTGRALQIVDRVGLDARRSLLVVRVGERAYLLGIGDGGPPAMLAELDPDELPPREEGRPAASLRALRGTRESDRNG